MMFLPVLVFFLAHSARADTECGSAKLVIYPTSSWQFTSYADHGTGADMDLGMWRPSAQWSPYLLYYAGDGCMPNYDNADYTTFLMSIGSDSQAVQLPTGMAFDWNDQGTGGDTDGGFYTPTCPDGYVALGSTGEQDIPDSDQNPPATHWPGLACVRQNYTLQQTFSNLCWADHGSGGVYDGSVFLGIEFTPPQGGQPIRGPCVGTGGYPDSVQGYVLDRALMCTCPCDGDIGIMSGGSLRLDGLTSVMI